jgi:hypothetical protein
LGPTDEFTVRGSGLTGPYWAPIPYSWPYPARRGAARRRARKTRHWRLLSAITGRVDIYLKRGRTETPERGPAGWFADHLGLFTKQTEKYSAKEFLRRHAKFLSEIHHRNVLLAEIDYEEVYVGRANRGTGELDDALAKAYDYLASHGEANKVLFSTFGRTNPVLKDGLEITLEAQYYRKHGHGKPGIEVRVFGIPSTLVRKPQEKDRDYRARIKQLFGKLSNVGKEKFARRYENTAKVLLKDYEHQLYKFFDVDKTTRWLHLEWGRTGEDLKPRVRF